jgi:hypothetical protein
MITLLIVQLATALGRLGTEAHAIWDEAQRLRRLHRGPTEE